MSIVRIEALACGTTITETWSDPRDKPEDDGGSGVMNFRSEAAVSAVPTSVILGLVPRIWSGNL